MQSAAHPLDRPVWSALSSRQAPLSLGGELARRLAPEYGLFAAAIDASQESLAALAALDCDDAGLCLVEAEPWPTPPGMVASAPAPCVQMTAKAITADDRQFAVTALTENDAPDMLALATLTRPGPFFARTHQLGEFVGIKQGGRLAAMAGERMRPDGFTEVSGVCTHPDHRGRGYAGDLMRIVASRILARGETPFLHAYETNNAAIELYRSLGFVLRRTVTLTTLTRRSMTPSCPTPTEGRP